MALSSVSVVALEVSPEAVVLKGPPGARLKAQLAVVNDSTSSVRVRLEFREIIPPGEKKWLRISPSRVKIEPGKSRVVDLRVSVPKKGTGERWAEVWVGVQGPVAWSELRTVRRVTLIIEGTEVYRLGVDSAVGIPGADGVTVNIEYRNAGNVSLRPKFGVELVMEGGEKASVFQEGVEAALLPGGRGAVQVKVPMRGIPWAGEGLATGYFRDGNGETRRSERRVER